MTHAVHGDVIVPDIALYSLHRISYLDLVRKVLAANPTKDLDLFTLNELWDAILSKVYDYEYDWREGKKNEVSCQRVLSNIEQPCIDPGGRAKTRAFENTSKLLRMLLSRKSASIRRSRRIPPIRILN